MQPNEIFIGRGKPAINYVLTASMMSESQNEIYLRARGDNISKAVDVALISTERFLKNFKINGIDIATQTFDDDDKKKNVSIINICLRRI